MSELSHTCGSELYGACSDEEKRCAKKKSRRPDHNSGFAGFLQQVEKLISSEYNKS